MGPPQYPSTVLVSVNAHNPGDLRIVHRAANPRLPWRTSVDLVLGLGQCNKGHSYPLSLISE